MSRQFVSLASSLHCLATILTEGQHYYQNTHSCKTNSYVVYVTADASYTPAVSKNSKHISVSSSSK